MPAADTRGAGRKGENRFHVASHSGPGQRAQDTQVSGQTSSRRGKNQRRSRRSTDVVPIPLPSKPHTASESQRSQTTFSRPTHAPEHSQPRTNNSKFPARNYERPAPYRLSDVRGRHLDPAPIVPVIAGGLLAKEHEWDIGYTAGFCEKSNTEAGLGVWWGPHDSRNLSEKCIGKQTIKRAELMSILRLLETNEITVKRLLIRTTSDYCIKCVKMIQVWKNNDWKTSGGKLVKNGGIIRCIAKYLEARANFGQQVVIAYAHSRKVDPGNDGAIALAVQGASLVCDRQEDWNALEGILECQLNRTIISLGRKAEETKVFGPQEVTESVLVEMSTKDQTVRIVHRLPI
ncbi:hypothetical protein GALMADRAFT_268998 [Galerina marginata CBS 339.88]|uniref:ribonuclease H n=1 Tax=Galerina marginata (strain CBS 339.88) TaxID=685588 RepID=A0A067SUT1_GALM3|nr:hypothetical protein GALMADRAFT_268998 [Galerina marginata CBS 339.88]